MLLHETPGESCCHQDKHKAPTPPHIRPLSLQDGSGCFPSLPHSVVKIHQDAGAHYRIRLSNIIRTGQRALPCSVVKNQQDIGPLAFLWIRYRLRFDRLYVVHQGLGLRVLLDFVLEDAAQDGNGVGVGRVHAEVGEAARAQVLAACVGSI